MNAVREFLRGLIDDAGTFPPEQLPLGRAMDRHVAAQRGPEAWMLGRFVTTSSSVGDLAASAAGNAWRLTVVIDHANVHEGFAAARAAGAQPGITVESIEIPLARGKGAHQSSRLSDLATQLTGAGLGRAELFVECPLVQGDDIAETAAALAYAAREQRISLFAKVRCGGADVPSPERLAAFITAMHGHDVPFKATAGLHQPIAFRAHDGAFAHGFLNVAGAAVLCSLGAAGHRELAEILADTDASHFRLDGEGFYWTSLSATAAQIAQARIDSFRSFGSCSLQEPVDGLMALGLLERAAS